MAQPGGSRVFVVSSSAGHQAAPAPPRRGPGHSPAACLVSPPEDAATRDVIDTLARYVARGGEAVERTALETNRDNPSFW